MEKILTALNLLKFTSKARGFKRSFISIILILMFNFSAGAAYSQQQKLNLKLKNAGLEEALKEIIKQTGYQVLYKTSDINSVKGLNFNFVQSTVEEILDKCLENSSLSCNIGKKTIVIRPITTEQKSTTKPIKIKGKITDLDGLPLPGATIVEKGTTNGTTTDFEGNYTLTVSGKNAVIQISYIGFETQEITVGAKKIINSVLKLSSNELDEVIVTGYSKRKKSSYTGATVSVTGKELKKYGNSNLIKSLQVFDPSFRIEENIEYGSDPNKLPKITVRGKSTFPDLSKSTLERNLNMPLFVLDGFEVDVERIYDLDLNRVKSVTILKDAASTAIYGSRASNGVIVVETKTPKAGSLQVTYTLDATITAPDLSDYHLMDAKKKLEAERRAGYYEYEAGAYGNAYQKLLYNVKDGVNTYWLSQPLQILLNHKHALSFEGGDENTRYGVHLKYDGKKGIMKGSVRNNYSLDFNFSYTFKGIKISNNLSITKLTKKDSNYGNFRQYTQLNPYIRIKDTKGKLIKNIVGIDDVSNPLYEASLNNRNNWNSSFYFSNSLAMEYFLFRDCKLAVSASYSETYDFKSNHISPESMRFKDAKRGFKGSDESSTLISSSLEAKAVLTYYKTIKKHVISIVSAANILENNSNSKGFGVIGFMNDKQTDIFFARQYQNRRPITSKSTDRLIGLLTNINYDFDNRYFLDASIRLDRSSQFGKLNRGAPFWSLGVGWNIKNDLFKNIDLISNLKITANIGATGSINIQPYQAFTTYEYLRRKRYFDDAVICGRLMAVGNDHLKWQTTFNRNIGFTSTLFDKYQLNFNYYLNTTKDLIIDVALPPSSGFKSFKSNLGEMENRGWDIAVSFTLIGNVEKDFNISFFANASHNENKILKIENHFKNYNDRVKKNLQKGEGDIEISNDENKKSGKALVNFDSAGNPIFYEEGKSLDEVYAVPSLGIDPATGNEIFIRKDGSLTFKWDPNDMQSFGKSTADINGYFGINLTYGKLTASFSFNFQAGNTKTYNGTLVDKIENADLQHNADERVLEKRWEKPGDIVFYKKIAGQRNYYTRASSRFIEDAGILTFNSASIAYNPLTEVAIKKLGLRDLRFSINLNDLLRFSTVKQERGLSYPFARSLSFSIQAYF
jgi:TonB-linked SusC/RagA family outer membrane protein